MSRGIRHYLESVRNRSKQARGSDEGGRIIRDNIERNIRQPRRRRHQLYDNALCGADVITGTANYRD